MSASLYSMLLFKKINTQKLSLVIIIHKVKHKEATQVCHISISKCLVSLTSFLTTFSSSSLSLALLSNALAFVIWGTFSFFSFTWSFVRISQQQINQTLLASHFPQIFNVILDMFLFWAFWLLSVNVSCNFLSGHHTGIYHSGLTKSPFEINNWFNPPTLWTWSLITVQAIKLCSMRFDVAISLLTENPLQH